MTLRIRTGEYRLPDDAFVVRGGRLNILDLANALDKCQTEHGVLGFSVYAADVPSVDELCHRATFLPHPQVCWTTAGQLRAIEAVELLPTWDAPHYTLVLPDSAGRLVSAVIDAFEGPIANPARRRTR